MEVSGDTDGAKLIWQLRERGVAKPDPVRPDCFPEDRLLLSGEVSPAAACGDESGRRNGSAAAIHAKLEKLEDKLIPKPSYASYLESSQPLRGQCELCGKSTDLINAKIVDNLGTRYRKVCRDCFAANGCEEQ